MNKSRGKFLSNSREEGDVLVGPSMVTVSFNKVKTYIIQSKALIHENHYMNNIYIFIYLNIMLKYV